MQTKEDIEKKMEEYKTKKHNAKVCGDELGVYDANLVLNTLNWVLCRTTTIFH